MLDKFFTKPLEMQVGEYKLKFSSIADFEFSLSGRTSVPSKKITDMVKFTVEQLKKEARTIKEVEKRFVAILSRSIEDPSSINRALRELDPLIFSQDHSWRDIINALNERDDDLNPFRRVALVKYMQYLSSRQEIIKYLYSDKRQQLQDGKEIENGDTTAFKDTLILDSSFFTSLDEEVSDDAMERMPKGEAITVILKPDEEIQVMLSKHVCKIASHDGIQFTDQLGRSYTLAKGRNLIGRDSVSNVMLEPSLRDISRLHLVIENYGDNTLQLTDLSSHGTYIPVKYIEQHSV